MPDFREGQRLVARWGRGWPRVRCAFAGIAVNSDYSGHWRPDHHDVAPFLMQCAVAGAACASRRGCLPCSVSCSSWACWRCPPSLPLLTVCLPSRRMASRLSRTRLSRHSRARNSRLPHLRRAGFLRRSRRGKSWRKAFSSACFPRNSTEAIRLKWCSCASIPRISILPWKRRVLKNSRCRLKPGPRARA